MDPLKIKTIVTRPGNHFIATASIFDQDGGPVNDTQITWKSSNPDVAAPERGIGQTAKIWSKKPGQASITACCDSVFQTFQVKVENLKPRKIEIVFTDPK